MPTVKKINQYKITIRVREHGVPHFHIVGQDCNMSVAIQTGEILDQDCKNPHQVKKALEWARANKATLQEAWDKWSGK